MGGLAAGVGLGVTGFGIFDSQDDAFDFMALIGFGLVMLIAGTNAPTTHKQLGHGLATGARNGVLVQIALADAAAIITLPLALAPERVAHTAVGSVATIAAAAAYAFIGHFSTKEETRLRRVPKENGSASSSSASTWTTRPTASRNSTSPAIFGEVTHLHVMRCSPSRVLAQPCSLGQLPSHITYLYPGTRGERPPPPTPWHTGRYMSTTQDPDPDLKVSLGRHKEFVIRNRFETASIAVDIAIAVVFITGSILFLFSLTKVGTVFFLLGSLAMAARPAIRLRRRMYLQKIGADREDADEEGSYY